MAGNCWKQSKPRLMTFTSARVHPTVSGCLEGKFDWVRQNIPQYTDRIIFTRDKWLLADLDRVLVDDNDDNCRLFREHGGISCKVPRVWNDMEPTLIGPSKSCRAGSPRLSQSK